VVAGKRRAPVGEYPDQFSALTLSPARPPKPD
jgi:hypothetical protein